jgi:hypothetical protein
MKISLTSNVDIQKRLHIIIFSEMNEVYSWKLSKNDLKVFAEFYNKDFELKSTITEYKDRMVVLFSKTVKDLLIKKLKISYNTFNNSLSKLRKKGLINKNTLNEKLLFNLNTKEVILTIKFISNE